MSNSENNSKKLTTKQRQTRAILGLVLFLFISFIVIFALPRPDIEFICDNHLVTNWSISKQPSCIDSGIKTGICERCGYSVEYILVKSEAYHLIDSWEVIQVPTCRQSGIEAGICSVCNSECTRTSAPTDHIESEWQISTAASLYGTGVKIKSCVECGEELDSIDYDLESYEEGMYKVGQDILPGEYLLICEQGKTGYFAITSDSSGNLDSIISNDNFKNNSIVTISEDEYLELSSCHAVLADDSLLLDTSNEGMFRVGVDIEPGEYKLINDSEHYGYYEITADSYHNDIISNDNFKNSAYITVQLGQYLKLSRCHIE